METVNVAVVGCGIFGEIHAAAYAHFNQSNLLAVCDIDEGRAKRLAERFGCRYVTCVEAVAADPDVQAVSVATPDFTHAGPCVELARAGKHILVEKPLATCVADAETIAGAAEQAGVICMVDFHNRYHPAFRSIKARLDSGQMGRPQMMYLRLSDRIEVATEWFNWSGKTGPEWFLGSHIADMACWLFGQMPRRVFAEGRKDVLASRGVDCYDSMQVHLSFPDGFATLETSWIMPNTWPAVVDFTVSLQATDGRADFALGNQGTTVADGKEYTWPFWLGQTPIAGDQFGYFGFPMRDFVRAVAAGGPAPVPVGEGVGNVRLLAAAVESAETGRVVPLDL